MIFDPWFWLFVFAAPVVFRALPRPLKPWWLVASSLAYLFKLSPTSATLAVTAGLLAYAAGRLAAAHEQRRTLIIRITVGLLIVLLGFWKYTPELVHAWAPEDAEPTSWFASLVYPIGLSFYVFRLIHYVIEAGRQTVTDTRLGTFLGYVVLVPIFTAGPIEQYDHFLKHADDDATASDVLIGLNRIAHGLVKKLVFAELIVHDALMWHPDMATLVENLPSETWSSTWAYLALFFAWGYFDFSAYSDIAIGASRLFGFRIAENFNWPFIADSVGDFWKRWHMTLAAFTQRYVYMPVIAHTRNPYIAVYCTFLVMGLWHAADLSYIAWGLYHATGVAAGLTFARIRRVRKWKPSKGVLRFWSVPLVLVFVCGSSIFSGTSGLGTQALGQVLSKALHLH